MYFECDWIVRPVADYGLLVDTAEALGCKLVVVSIEKTEEGFMCLPIILHAPSADVFKIFVEKSAQRIGIAWWYPVTEKHFARGEDFGQLLSGELGPLSLENLLRYGMMNEVLEDKLLHKNEISLFFRCDWIVTLQQIMYLPDVLRTAKKLNCSFYRLWDDISADGYTIQVFGLRVPSVLVLENFVKQIGEKNRFS